jgi:hypothetical protein
MRVPNEASSAMRRPWPIAVAILVTVPLTAGIVQAAIPDANTGEITVCYKPYTGYMRLIDTDSVPACASDEKKLSWYQDGQATKLWARVKADGTVEDESGVDSVVALTGSDVGKYEVMFEQDVLQCAAVASPTSFNNTFVGDRVVGTGTGAVAPKRIRVLTQRFDSGHFVDEKSDFNIAVFC